MSAISRSKRMLPFDAVPIWLRASPPLDGKIIRSPKSIFSIGLYGPQKNQTLWKTVFLTSEPRQMAISYPSKTLAGSAKKSNPRPRADLACP